MTQRVPLTDENAPYGQTFHHAEAAIINKGREFIQHSLQTLTQEEIDDIEKTILPVLRGETRKCPKCQTKKRHLGHRNKNIFTAEHHVRCPCFPAARRSGWKTSFSPHFSDKTTSVATLPLQP